MDDAGQCSLVWSEYRCVSTLGERALLVDNADPHTSLVTQGLDSLGASVTCSPLILLLAKSVNIR